MASEYVIRVVDDAKPGITTWELIIDGEVVESGEWTEEQRHVDLRESDDFAAKTWSAFGDLVNSLSALGHEQRHGRVYIIDAWEDLDDLPPGARFVAKGELRKPGA